jgi:predicted dehydrogenase
MITALLIGSGSMAKSCHLPVLMGTPGVVCAGVVVRTRRCDSTSEAPATFTDVHEALETTRPNLAVVATPHDCHFEQVRECLWAGCHVLVEKPLALRYEQCQELVALAENQQQLLVVGLQRRYEGFARYAKEMVVRGELGRVTLAHGLFAHRFDASPHGWRSDSMRCGAGIVDDSGMHLLDLMVYLCGRAVSEVTGRLLSTSDRHPPHSFSCFYQASNADLVAASCSYEAPANSVQEEISIYGEAGSIFARRFAPEWNTLPPRVVFKKADGGELAEVPIAVERSARSLPLCALIDVISGRAGRETILSEGKDVLETHRVASLVRRSGRTTTNARRVSS